MDIMTANIQRHMRHSSSRNASRNASRNVSVAPEQKISTGHNENIGEANVSQRVSIDDEEKTRPVAQTPSHGAGYDLNGNVLDIDGEYVVTAKTWAVVTVLAFSYGISFWPVPYMSTIQSAVAAKLGEPAQGVWFTSVYTMAGTITFMICGANSDLFGRRWFIIGGNVLLFVGSIIVATGKTTTAIIAGQTLIGMSAGTCQLAAFALPELLPNKWRHIGVVMADGGIYFTVIIGPAAARYAIIDGDNWVWGFYGCAITAAISFVLLVAFYFPPKHPRGISFGQAMRDLDYVGIVSFTAAAALILSGVVYSIFLKSTDPIVIGTLVAGFATLIFFCLWETFMPLKQPLTPTRMFTKHKGRSLSAPFLVGFVVTMFYYGTNILWGSSIATIYTIPSDPVSYSAKLSLVQGFGITLGATILSVGGTFFARHGFNWKWQITIAVTIMTIFGSLLALQTPDRLAMGIVFAFISATGYGFAQYLSIAYIQFGADQVELGIAGGLAGVARYAGGAVAVTIYETILINVQAIQAAKLVPVAVIKAGGTRAIGEKLVTAIPLGMAAIEAVQGTTIEMVTVAGAAFVQSYVVALRSIALTSLAFGVLAIIACLFCEDIGDKMDSKIEIFLENDVQAEKNRFH